MYVRHGDKDLEMKVLPLSNYLDAAVYLREHDMILGSDEEFGMAKSNGRSLLKGGKGKGTGLRATSSGIDLNNIFIGSEDPDIIQEAYEWGRRHRVNVFFTNLFNRSQVSARLDFQAANNIRSDCKGCGYSMVGEKTERIQKSSNTTSPLPIVSHHPLEYLSMIINLFYLLTCDAWVCTLKSNYCRLVDELRATVGGKANRFFADLSEETCSRPPCLGGENITTFDWR